MRFANIGVLNFSESWMTFMNKSIPGRISRIYLDFSLFTIIIIIAASSYPKVDNHCSLFWDFLLQLSYECMISFMYSQLLQHQKHESIMVGSLFCIFNMNNVCWNIMLRILKLCWKIQLSLSNFARKW